MPTPCTRNDVNFLRIHPNGMETLSPDPKQQLDDILRYYGVQENIFLAEPSLALHAVIGRRAYQTNDAKFGDLFGNLQEISYEYAILAVTRLFEPEKRYSLPEAEAK